MQAGAKSETAPMKLALNSIVFARIMMIAKFIVEEAGIGDMHSNIEFLANLLVFPASSMKNFASNFHP